MKKMNRSELIGKLEEKNRQYEMVVSDLNSERKLNEENITKIKNLNERIGRINTAHNNLTNQISDYKIERSVLLRVIKNLEEQLVAKNG